MRQILAVIMIIGGCLCVSGCNREASDSEIERACDHLVKVVDEEQRESMSADPSLGDVGGMLGGLGLAASCANDILNPFKQSKNKSIKWVRCIDGADSSEEIRTCNAEERER